ncbi:MAG: hypothetical protein ACPHK8_06530, partial [Thermoplasmatota archaeon]
MLALLVPEADAATIDVDNTVIQQGGSVTLTVTMDPGEFFGTTDVIEVTMPNGCKYSSTVSVTEDSKTYPSDFTADSGNDALCKGSANTHMSGVQTRDYYRAAFIPSATLGVAGDSVDFYATMTSGTVFERSEEVVFTARGYAAGTTVNFYLDAPTQDNFYSNNSIVANSQGVVEARFVLPVGRQDGQDLGAWTAHFLETGNPNKATEDRQDIIVGPTTITSQWLTQPTNPTPRMSSSGATLQMLYAGSLGNSGGPIPLTGQDLESIQYDLSLEMDSGSGFEPLTGATASYDQAAGIWRVSYVAEKDRAVGTYRFSADADADRYSNDILAASVSQPFQIVGTEVQANFTVLSPVVERGSDVFPLNLDVKLTYPDGTPLTPADLADVGENFDGESITLGVRRDGAPVQGVQFTANFVSGGVWKVGGQALSPAIPVGEVTVYVASPTVANPTVSPPNTVNTTASSDPFTVHATKPLLNMFFFDSDGLERSAYLRGKVVRFEVDAQYSGFGPMTPAQIEDPVGVGIAQIRVSPPSTFNPDGTVRENTFTLDLQYDSQTATWGTAYTIKGTDPAGKWRVAAVMKDAYNNKNTTEGVLNVGLIVDVQASPATGLVRGDNVDVDAKLTRPDGTVIAAGTVKYSVLGPGANIVTGQTMVLDSAQQSYKASFTIPNDALLGTYRIEVLADTNDDKGVGIHEFSLGSSSMQVTEVTIGDEEVPRLGSLDASFKLAYSNGDPVPGTVVPVVEVSNGETVATLAPTLADGIWSVTYAPGKNAPLGEHRFLISALDGAGNSIEDFATSAFDVEGAEIVVTSLAPAELRYDRGESINILASLEYIDETPVLGATIPVKVYAGSDVVATVTLTETTAGDYSGNYTIRLADPLSTSTAPWSLRIAENTVVDADDNIGPAIEVSDANNQFSVEPARLSVEFVDTPTGVFKVGTDEVSVKFRLVAVDGSAISEDVSNLVVSLRKGSADAGTATVVRSADEFT